MPLRYEIVNDLVILRAKGNVNNADHRAIFAECVEDPGFQRGSKVLLFDTDGKYAPVGQEGAEFVMILKEYQESHFGRFAVVVTSIFHWGIGRLLAAYATHYNVEFRVFRDETRARNWLFEGAKSPKPL